MLLQKERRARGSGDKGFGRSSFEMRATQSNVKGHVKGHVKGKFANTVATTAAHAAGNTEIGCRR